MNSEVCLHPLHLPAPDIMLVAVAVQMVQAACTAPAPLAPPLHRSCTAPAPSTPPQALYPALSAPHTSILIITDATVSKKFLTKSD